MAVSKRTRFEVLKRDNHTCRYCGGTAPDAILTVDHVTPVALGGSDDPSNLVAACRDCNFGKGSTSPDAALVAEVGEDDMRWAAAVKRAADDMVAQRQTDDDRLDWFLSSWRNWDANDGYLPLGWAKSVDHWMGAGLPQPVLIDCLEIALANRGVAHSAVFAYMGGIARKKIGDLHDAAREILDAEAGRPDGS